MVKGFMHISTLKKLRLTVSCVAYLLHGALMNQLMNRKVLS